MIAGAYQAQKELISKLGKHLRLAFQLKDDLADITLTDTTKSLFSDIQEGQQTFFTNYIFTKGSEEDKALLSSCMRKELSDTEITSLQNLFTRSGAIDAGIALLGSHAEHANEVLHQISFVSQDVVPYFEQLITKISAQ